MALPIIADTYRVVLNWQHVSGQRAVNVLHILRSGTTASVIAASMDANVTTNMWAQSDINGGVNRVDVTPLDGSSSTYSLAVSAAKWNGGSTPTGDFSPAGAQLIKLTTLFRGPANRGRLYLPFIADAKTANGVVGAGFLAAQQTAWNTWLAAMIAAGSQPVVASYVHSNQHPVSSILVEGTLGTQRRRQSRLR